MALVAGAGRRCTYTVCTAVSSADRAESLGFWGRIIIAAHRAFVSLGVRDAGTTWATGIAELRTRPAHDLTAPFAA